jgi:hypothetical protein
MGLPNPYLVLGTVLAMIGIGAGGYLYGKHEQTTSDDLKAKTLALAQAQKILNLEAIANGKEVTAQSEVTHQRETYESQLKQTQALVASLSATGNSLRQQLAQYSGSGNVPQTAGGTVCPADPRVAVLAASTGELADAGADLAGQVRDCATKLQSAEAWIMTVQKEQQ